VPQRRGVGDQHLGGAVQLRRGLGGGGDAFAGDQHVDLAEALHGGQRLGGGVEREIRAVELRDQKNGHQITPASSFSFATSSSTLATRTPALRAGGSTTDSTVSRGATSTPKSAAVFMSIGFFLAFMMLGSEA
jgi:hypothetical protein